MGLFDSHLANSNQSAIVAGILGLRTRSSWNDRFVHWEKPESVSEAGTIERAWDMVHKSIYANAWVESEGLSIFPQGSYHNRTNVRQEADIDLRVVAPLIKPVYDPNVFYSVAHEQSHYRTFNFSWADYAAQMRSQLGSALRTTFGTDNVDASGNKAIAISGLTGSRAKVDVVPCFNLDYYYQGGLLGEPIRVQGIAIFGKDATWTYNFPDLHHTRGKEKRESTGHRFKKMVRIFKRLRDEMRTGGLQAAKIPSFLVECLVFNVEDAYFLVEADDRYGRVKRICDRMDEQLRSAEASQMREIGVHKLLFSPQQAWTLDQAKAFTAAVKSYLVVAS